MNLSLKIILAFLLSTTSVSAKENIRINHNHFIYYVCKSGTDYFVFDHTHSHNLKQNKHKHLLSSRCPHTDELKKKNITTLQNKLMSLGFFNGEINGKLTPELKESLIHFELIREELETNA